MFIQKLKEFAIEDTWHVMGLKGTGSNHVRLVNAFVADRYCFEMFDGPVSVAGSCVRRADAVHPDRPIAEGALRDLVASASPGRQQLNVRTTMRESQLFQYELGRLDAQVRAARALLYWEADDLWRHVQTDGLHDNALFTRSFQTGIWVHETCARVIDQCFTMGGGTVLFETSPLQRRLRDIHVAGQHHAMHLRRYALAGAVKLGLPAVNPMIG